MKKTIVINLLGGPGAGKTTCAWEVAEKLKKKGYVTEYVSEYAKELVWDDRFELLDGSVDNQESILREQKHRIDRLIGKVDFIVTDAPIILNSIYLEANEITKKEYEKELVKKFNGYNNFNLFVQRGDKFEKEGRIHNELESRKIDENLKKLFEENELYCGVYTHRTIDISVNNVVAHLQRLNKSLEKEKSIDKYVVTVYSVSDWNEDKKMYESKEDIDSTIFIGKDAAENKFSILAGRCNEFEMIEMSFNGEILGAFFHEPSLENDISLKQDNSVDLD